MTDLQAPNTRDIPVSCDPLGEALYLLRLNGSLYCHSVLQAPWGVEMPALPDKMMFHILSQGECLLEVEGFPAITLSAGSLVLLPHGKGHKIYSADAQGCTPLFDIEVTKLSERYEQMRFGGNGEVTELTCGVMSFDHIAGQKLLQQLPAVVHIEQWNTIQNEWLHSTLRFLSLEAKQLKAGGETIMGHLSDILVIQAIRHWIEQAPQAQTGWLGALQDAKLGKALQAMHSAPETPWTVDRLAQVAGMSRSNFSARFTELVGVSVKQYLTEWRMNLARTYLKQASINLPELAEKLGYQSEAAFSRAYKRIMGTSPMRQLNAANNDDKLSI